MTEVKIMEKISKFVEYLTVDRFKCYDCSTRISAPLFIL
jgi:hypothetical protein